eukprot:5807686-Pyramimonas_sp.AAC.1
MPGGNMLAPHLRLAPDPGICSLSSFNWPPTAGGGGAAGGGPAGGSGRGGGAVRRQRCLRGDLRIGQAEQLHRRAHPPRCVSHKRNTNVTLS